MNIKFNPHKRLHLKEIASFLSAVSALEIGQKFSVGEKRELGVCV